MTRLVGYFSLILLSLNLGATSVFAQQPPTQLALKQGAPTTYTVVKGDTLWDISAMYLNDPWLWPQLWDINSEIKNPHLIYPGDQLYLVWQNGKPKLMFKPKVTLSPKVKRVKKQPVTVVEQGLVLPYLQSDQLVDMTNIETSSRVVGNNEGRQYISVDDKLYFSGHHSHLKWGVYKLSEEYHRGSEVITALRLIATGQLISSNESVSALKIEQQSQEIMLNDLLLPIVDINTLNLTTTFFPSPSPTGSEAHILGSLEGGDYVAQNQVVVLDRGSEDGLKQGSMFDIHQDGSLVFGSPGNLSYEKEWFDKSQRLPDNKVGELMVIRPYPKFSLALITSSKTAVGTNAKAVSPLTIN